jgi:hypothetical protein
MIWKIFDSIKKVLSEYQISIATQIFYNIDKQKNSTLGLQMGLGIKYI